VKESLFADQDFNLSLLLARTREALFKVKQKELNKYGISARKAAALFAVTAIGS